MKKLLFVVLLALYVNHAQSQNPTPPDNNPVMVTIYSVPVITEDPGFSLDTMIMTYIDKGIRPNPMIKNFRILRHWWGSDNTKVMFIYELDKFENINKAPQKTAELLNASFKNDADRKEFWSRWGKIFNRHEDNIMTDAGKPKM